MSTSPIRDITFGQALNISLDHYYDLLSTSVGSLATNEHIQLKLVADPVDIDSETYPWFSYYNLLNRSDRAIDPDPVSGGINAGSARLWQEYRNFLYLLSRYVDQRKLSLDERKRIAAIDTLLTANKDERLRLTLDDHVQWSNYCNLTGTDPTNSSDHSNWSVQFGSADRIAILESERDHLLFERALINDSKYDNPADIDIVNARVSFDSPRSKLRYPMLADSAYDDGNDFSAQYLYAKPPGSPAFDSRRAIFWDQDLSTIETASQGYFDNKFDSSSTTSNSIETKWGYSGGASGFFGLFKAKLDANSYKKVQEEFSKKLSIGLAAAAAFRVNVIYPNWFNPTLFSNLRVKENIEAFEPFFGLRGTLKHYPTALIMVRGFKVNFVSDQTWKFDYKKTFSAKSGGGATIFGIKFGSKKSYSSTEEEHNVEQSGTSLSFGDSDKTLRFVGYAVARNTVYEDTINSQFVDLSKQVKSS